MLLDWINVLKKHRFWHFDDESNESFDDKNVNLEASFSDFNLFSELFWKRKQTWLDDFSYRTDLNQLTGPVIIVLIRYWQIFCVEVMIDQRRLNLMLIILINL